MTQSAKQSGAGSKGGEMSAAAIKDTAVKNIEKGVEVAQETISDVTEQASAEVRKATESGLEFVRENPAAAVAGALGIGVLLGLALRGRY